MGRKVFISYKYGDSFVEHLPEHGLDTTARHYVDLIQEKIGKENINKGEKDGEDMAQLSDSTIQSKLGDKIYDSSITIVLISPHMKNEGEQEKDQWIPWEISYSLREQSRNGRKSKTNGVLAVVLPDLWGKYDYFMEEHTCPYCASITYKTNTLFDILRENMFNRKEKVYSTCNNHSEWNKPETGYFSYIHCVKWNAFINDPERYFKIIDSIVDNSINYVISKKLT